MRFDGAVAREHVLGMRQLGESLIGIERLITVGLFALETGRHPKRNERLPLLVRASESRPGSYEIAAILGPAPSFLPLLHNIFLTGASDILWNWMSGALLRMGGREKDSDAHLSKLMDLLDTIDSRRHAEILNWQRLYPLAQQVVSPVGSSCDRILLPQGGQTTEIDLPIAEAIRSKGKLEVGDMDTFLIKIDGFTHHNKQLKGRAPDRAKPIYNCTCA